MMSPTKQAFAEAISYEDPPELEERQAAPRSSVWVAGRLTAGELTFPCDVLNVSAGGVRIRSAQTCVPETEMTLQIDGHAGITVKEAWRSDDLAGLRFVAPPEAVTGFLRSLETVEPSIMEQRRFRRCSVLWTACVFSAGRTIDAVVLNLSAGGARVRLKQMAALDDRATVSIGRFGDFAGRVVWRDGDEIGLEFLDPPERIVAKVGDTLPRIRADFERWQSPPG